MFVYRCDENVFPELQKAPAMPVQCQYSSRTMPAQCPYSAHWKKVGLRDFSDFTGFELNL